MKTRLSPQQFQRGSGLLITMVLTTISLATLATAMAWSTSTARLNERTSQHARSVAAAEAVTEAVLARIGRDHREGGLKLVTENLNAYRQNVLTPAQSSGWKGWEFSDARGNAGRTFVELGAYTNWVLVDGAFTGLKGWISGVNVVSNARLTNSIQNVVAGVRQSAQLATIPIFQFAMYSSGLMEISCGQDFNVTGRVHANGTIYVEPDADLTFLSSVTSSENILFQRHPLDSRGAPLGTVDYRSTKRGAMPSLTLPIGSDNSPTAVRQIIEPPPAGESAASVLGSQRLYNQADIIVTVSGSSGSGSGGITGTTSVPRGRANIPASQVRQFINTVGTFTDSRELKVVRPVNFDVGAFRTWAMTNRALFGGNYPSSIYIDDRRNEAVDLKAVRVLNGRRLPPAGLTIATDRPLYVQGHYNQYDDAKLGTSDTSTTYPAALVADAVTILSKDWSDVRSALAVSARPAGSTTVNAAILTGVVETQRDGYSGGMENFPRFLETWGASAVLTYNGSMVKMFPSRYAIAPWGRPNVYAPPARNWYYDVNFDSPYKLPPLTPCLQKVLRGEWSALAPGQTTRAATL